MNKILYGIVVLSSLYSTYSTSALAGQPTGESGIVRNGITSVHDRISEANAKFADTVLTMPDKNLDVVVFFSGDMPLKDTLAKLNGYSMDVHGFRHGTPEHSGGYSLRGDESVAEAEAQYRRDHEYFMEQDLIFTKKMMQDPSSDETMRTAWAARHNAILQRQEDYARNGMRIVGVELKGKAGEIDRFRKNNSERIKVIEMSDNRRPQPNLFNAPEQ